jgi:K319-like protein
MKKIEYNFLTISITLLSLIFIIGLVYGQEASPIADAGSSRIVTSGKNVTLDGSNSNDPDGDSLNYYWYQIGGQNVSLSDISIANPTFIAPKVANPTILR